MKLRMMSFWLALIMLLSVSPTYSYASENENQGEVVEITEDDPATLNAAEYTEWYAVTMQGDTESPSDCKAFEYTMTLCNDGYEYSRCGWTVNSSGTADFDGSIVTQSQFVNAKYYDVAYYSGHGGSVWDTEREINKPCLNYLSSDSPKNPCGRRI